MTFLDWIPAISSSLVLAVVGFVAGVLLKASAEKGLGHAFDAKLESLKGEIRKDEEEFKAALRRNDEQVLALRAGPLSGVAARNAALSQRWALAVERIWGEVIDLGRFKFLSQMAQTLNMNELMNRGSGTGAEAANIQKFAAMILEVGGFKDNESFKSNGAADKERPFVDPVSWSLFSAYRLLLSMPALQLSLIKAGVGSKFMKDSTTQLAPVRAALPEWTDFIDNHQLESLPFLVQPLEEKLLTSLVRVLEGKDVDEGAVVQAAEVVAAVDKVVVQMNEAATPTLAEPVH